MQRIQFISLLVCVVISQYHCDVVVLTKYGQVRGLKTSKALAFLGIPYAQPPVQNLRWQPPKEPEPWQPNVYNAIELQPGCPQHGCISSNPTFVCPTKTSESCLFLNIWTPLNASASSSRLPVMVYIHGGNFVHMSASSPLFNGEYFAMKGQVILVTLDYRLGVFGFLYTGESNADAKGNYGILDQKLALEWVQDNIKNFGGDPEKVTLFGQSAGAQSTTIHLMSQDSASLFRNVILESSPYDIPFKTRVEALYLASTIKKLLNCSEFDHLECLMTKTADEIAEAQLQSRTKPSSLKILEFFEPLGPFVDGHIVPMEPVEAIQNNKIRNVPAMIGTVSEEVRVFVYEAWHKALSPEAYIAVLFATYPPHVNQMLQMYPTGNSTDARDILTKLGTDFIFTCSARNMSRNFIKHEGNVYRYVFDHSFSFNGWGNFTFCEGHVCHGEEIAYVFHSADQSGFNFDQSEEVLSDSMIYYWSNFAYTSDPNKGPHTPSPQWPKYDNENNILKLQTPQNKVIQTYMEKYCDLWDSIGYTA